MDNKAFRQRVLELVEAIPVRAWQPVWSMGYCSEFQATTAAGASVRLEYTTRGDDNTSTSWIYRVYVDESLAAEDISGNGIWPTRIGRLYNRLYKEHRIKKRMDEMKAAAKAASEREACDRERARQQSILNKLR